MKQPSRSAPDPWCIFRLTKMVWNWVTLWVGLKQWNLDQRTYGCRGCLRNTSTDLALESLNLCAWPSLCTGYSTASGGRSFCECVELLCTQNKMDRVECLAEHEPVDQDQNNDDVLEFGSRKDRGSSTPRIDAPQVSPDFVRKMYQSLNETQASVSTAFNSGALD